MEFKKSLFFRAILPFGIGGGIVLFIFTLLIYIFGANPLDDYFRNWDLLIFVVIIATMLIRYNLLTEKKHLFSEIFLSAFACFVFALLVYLLLTYCWLKITPALLTDYVNLKVKFMIENKRKMMAFYQKAADYERDLKILKTTKITATNFIKGQLELKGISGLVITAFLAILFRFTTFVTRERKKV